MSEPFTAEIRIFAGNFAPRSWAFCDGQLMPISQYTALFSLVGTTYGGDGRTTFGIPNLQGRAPMHPGRGPGLTARRLGQREGVETVQLVESQIPQHTHTSIVTVENGGTSITPEGLYSGESSGDNIYQEEANSSNLVQMKPDSLAHVGGGQPHNNIQPYLAMNFIIALNGIYPERS